MNNQQVSFEIVATKFVFKSDSMLKEIIKDLCLLLSYVFLENDLE